MIYTYKEFSETLSDKQRKFLEERFNERLKSAEKILTFIEDRKPCSEFNSFYSEAGVYIRSASTFNNLLCDSELEKRLEECLWKFLTMERFNGKTNA